MHAPCACEAQQREIGFCEETTPQLQLPSGAAVTQVSRTYCKREEGLP